MIYYLYKKTHRTTGLQYLGKTVQDPFKYKGSGKRWGYHIKKHGYDVDTEILLETLDEQELIKIGLYYSKLWNIVESKEWANLKPEAGDGGGMPEASRKQFAEKMKGHPNWSKPWSENAKQNLAKIQKENLANLTAEEKIARVKNSCCHPDTYTAERSNNISKALTGLKRSEINKKNSSTAAKKHRSSLKIEERQQIYGAKNAGKTWKLVNGKRVWMNKESQNY
jgi:hypothetical protein